MRVDLVLTTDPPDVRAAVAALAGTGIDGVATVEGPHDVFAPLVQACCVADLDVATYLAIAFPRSPVHLAHAAWDLQALSGGRFRLGLGTQVRAHVERRYGADFDHPVARMQEWIEALRAIFACWQTGEPLRFEGRFTAHTWMPPFLRPPPLDSGPPPILVGGVGPRMVQMITRVADGIVLHPFTSPAFLDEVLGRVDAGLADAGRERSAFEVVGGSLVAVGDGPAARDAARAMVAVYGSTPAYRGVLDAEGAGELQPVLQDLVRAGRWDELAAHVHDDLLDRLAVVGPAGQVGARLAARFGDRVDRLAVTATTPLTPADVAELVTALHP